MGMSNKKQQIPALRFKGFTDEWEQRKLRDVGNVVTGSTPSTLDRTNYNGTYLFISPADIQGNRYVDKTITTLSEKGFRKGRILKEGAILFVSIGSTIGKVAQIRQKAVTNQQINAIVPYKNYDENFIFSYLVKGSEKIKLLSATQTIPIINKTTFSNIDIYIPENIEEQTQIGIFFNKLDDTFALHQRQLNNHKELKKALLQKMFPQNGEEIPEVRFDGFTEAWEQRKLKEFGEATGGTSIESEFIAGGKYKVVSIGSYSEKSIYTDQGIRANITDKTKNRILNKDDLTMILNDKTTSGNIIGRVLLIDKDDEYVYNQRTERIVPKHDKYSSQFIYQLLNAPEIRSKIIKQAQGNTQIYVNWSNISELDYLIPKKEEQIKIGTFLKQLDNTIAFHQQKLNDYQQLKKVVLEQMFV